MSHKPLRNQTRTDKDTDLDIPLLGSFGEVWGGDKRNLAIHDDALGMRARALLGIGLRTPSSGSSNSTAAHWRASVTDRRDREQRDVKFERQMAFGRVGQVAVGGPLATSVAGGAVWVHNGTQVR